MRFGIKPWTPWRKLDAMQRAEDVQVYTGNKIHNSANGVTLLQQSTGRSNLPMQWCAGKGRTGENCFLVNMDVNNTGLKVLRKLEFASYLQHVFLSNSEYKLDRAPLSSARLSLSELVMCTSLSLCISSEKICHLWQPCSFAFGNMIATWEKVKNVLCHIAQQNIVKTIN